MVADDVLKKFQRIIDYNFTDEQLLRHALTHSSTGAAVNYERLEFLGDRVLGLVVSEILFEKFPHEQEGDLAKRLASLVQGSWLAEVALTINLGDYVRLSEAEALSGGAENAHILADVIEAVIGAIYLDTRFRDGGLVACRAFIEKLWGDAFFTMKKPPQHPKTALQEWLQSRGLSLPEYKISQQSGPDHAPVFEVSLRVSDYDPVFAEGKSRQEAEKAAASAFLSAYTTEQGE